MMTSSGSRRFLSLWLTHWSTDQYRRRQRRKARSSSMSASVQRETAMPPLVLAAQSGNRQVIQAVDPRAAKHGVKVGMAVADARAWLPQLAVETHDPAADAADLRRLADWATRFSPLVAPDGTDGVMLDIAGCAHLWGSEAKMLTTIQVSTVSRKICRTLSYAFEWPRLPSHSMAPAKPVITAEPTKPRLSLWK